MSKSPEAKITPKIAKWFQKQVTNSCPFEIKHTKGNDRFMVNELSQHQRDWLLAATTPRGMVWKIPDANIGYIPFDCILYKKSIAYIIIVYPQYVIALDIRHILDLKNPSLKESEALKISSFKVLLKDL